MDSEIFEFSVKAALLALIFVVAVVVVLFPVFISMFANLIWPISLLIISFPLGIFIFGILLGVLEKKFD